MAAVVGDVAFVLCRLDLLDKLVLALGRRGRGQHQGAGERPDVAWAMWKRGHITEPLGQIRMLDDGRRAAGFTLEVDHESGPQDLIVAKIRPARGSVKTIVCNVAVDVVELHASVRRPMPIDAEGDILSNAALNILIGKVCVRVAQG